MKTSRSWLSVGLLLGVLTFAASVPSAASAQASMTPRVDLLFRLGFAGRLRLQVARAAASRAADTSPGVDLRVDVPVLKYLTLGPVVSFYAVRARGSGQARTPVVDISPFLKGRYPFLMGGKRSELYGVFQCGFTMAWLRKSTGANDRFGPGWNIGLAVGLQWLVAKHFGVITELGWLRTEGNLDFGNLVEIGDLRDVINQAVWRVGVVF